MQSESKPFSNGLLTPLQDFLRLESAAGIVLMGAAVLALILANSPLAPYYASLLEIPVEMRIGELGLEKPLLLWINDGLMAVFFLLVGLELKREIVEGHLSSLRQAALPLFAAFGGMAGPAIIYTLFNSGDPIAMKGWAIGSATDIAFALGVLALLGSRVPPALKAFLLSLAIFDDLGAIVVIAIFYTAELSTTALIVSGVLIAGLAVLNRFGVVKPAAYFLLGVPLWFAVLKSGVHATVAGVVLAMFIPIRIPSTKGSKEPLDAPLHRLEHALHPWVAFGILPIFALTNAGVPILGLTIGDLLHPVPMGIAIGLFAGNLLGIMSMSFISIRLRLASLPDDTRWSHILGTSMLCGIGFTMSLFIASLAFEQGAAAYIGLERLGILVGSLFSGLAGYAILRTVIPKSG